MVPSSQNKNGARLVDFLMAFVLILLLTLLVEQTVRFYLFGVHSLSYEKMKSLGPMAYAGYFKKAASPRVVYDFKPAIDSYFKLAHFKTNSYGLRDKEYTIEKPANTFRVAVVGGSFTVPAGVEIDEAFHSLLETRFNRENTRLNYEFINFGVSGYRINNKIATLEHKALDYNPDVVLFILDGSQFTQNEQKIFLAKAQKNQFFHSFAYEFLSIKLSSISSSKNQQSLDKNKTDLDQLNRQLGGLYQISTANNVPIFIVILDYDQRHYELSEEIKTVVESNELFYINTIPAFKNMDISDVVLSKIDAHPNSKANQIFSDTIYRDLTSQLSRSEK